MNTKTKVFWFVCSALEVGLWIAAWAALGFFGGVLIVLFYPWMTVLTRKRYTYLRLLFRVVAISLIAYLICGFVTMFIRWHSPSQGPSDFVNALMFSGIAYAFSLAISAVVLFPSLIVSRFSTKRMGLIK